MPSPQYQAATNFSAADVAEQLPSHDRRGPIRALTGLRFVAALMVFVSHYPIPGVDGVFLQATKSGYVGVTFFFILSGFVLTYNYLDSFERNVRANVISYATSRFARVYPLYLFCTLFVWLTDGAHADLPVYLLALQAWSPSVFVAYGLDGPSWSISVEVFLYAMFPMVIFAFSRLGIFRSKRKVVACGIVFAVLLFGFATVFSLTGRGDLTSIDPMSAHRWLYRTPVTRLLDFALGILAAVYFIRFSKPERTNSGLLWSAITYLSGAAVLIMMGSSSIYYTSYGWDSAYAIPFTFIIIGLAIQQKSFLAKYLSGPTLILLGESSFAFYLIHIVVHGMNAGGGSYPIANYLMFLIFVIAISVGLHVSIEKPCRKIILSFKLPAWVRRA